MLYQHRNSSLRDPCIQCRICSWLVLPGNQIHQHSNPCSQQQYKSQLLAQVQLDKGPLYQDNNHHAGDTIDHRNNLSHSILHSYHSNSTLCTQLLHMIQQRGTLRLCLNNRYQGYDTWNHMSRLVGCQSSTLLCSNSHIRLQHTNQEHL